MHERIKRIAAALLASAAFGFAGAAAAQSPAKAPDDPAPAAQPSGGIQGQNIFDVKPEVKKDASSEPGYMDQNNAQRNQVQPGNNSPMWRGVQQGLEGYTSLPKRQDPEAGVLIQGPAAYPGAPRTTAGEAWRQVRNNWLIPYGGALLLIVAGAIAIFYFTKGQLGHADGQGGGKRIERFTPFERSAHWANAIAFVILGVSGIVMAFGKFFLLPVIGSTLFGYLTYILKNLHNFAGPVFAVSLLIVFFTFLRDNWPQRGDLKWLLSFGGLLGKGPEVPSHRFNAAEKLVFWGGVLFLGLIVVGSGLVLDKLIPNLLYERSTMQIAHMVHSVSTYLMMAMFIGHIYIGTIGMKGAYKAMRTGYVDEAWAKEHHEYWYNDVKAGKIPAQRSKAPVVAASDEAPRAA